MTSGSVLLQRVVFPIVHDPDVLPLYVDADHWTMLPDPHGRSVNTGAGVEHSTRAVRLSDFGTLSSIRGRRGFVVPHRRKVSFASYFNAFPASYWRKWTVLDAVSLQITLSGTGTVLVYRSNARGVVQRVTSRDVKGRSDLEFELPLKQFGDGGWYWFDLVTENEDFELIEAGWYSTRTLEELPATVPQGGVSVAITTLNRVDYCADVLRTLAEDPDVVASIDRVYVVDQGTQRLRDADGFAEIVDALGGKLEVIEQDNLGGSGGFSRGMLETVTAGESDYLLILDDDVAVEPESIRRGLQFARLSKTPTIVGGHMFDMFDKSKLHSFAEGFDMRNFVWGSLTPTRHDLGASNLRQTKWLHRRTDAQYNGWWMCLIPVAVLKEIGLSLPVFIKWDDSEYALRAADAGFPTVSLPGMAVWHVSWVDKDDSIDWQAFFHARNRLVAALLHSPMRKGGRLTRANLAIDAKHMLTLQYFAMEARLQAYRSILDGPQSLHQDMRDRLPRTRALLERFPDGRTQAEDDVPGPRREKSDFRLRSRIKPDVPGGLGTLAWLLRVVPRQLFTPVSSQRRQNPQAHLAFEDAKWWVTAHYDSYLVTNADGSGVMWYRRDPRQLRRMLWESWRLRRRIRRRWPQLSRDYRSALPEITSARTWSRSFGIGTDSSTFDSHARADASR